MVMRLLWHDGDHPAQRRPYLCTFIDYVFGKVYPMIVKTFFPA
jgi:hypothetical protein